LINRNDVVDFIDASATTIAVANDRENRSTIEPEKANGNSQRIEKWQIR
jgi:hypothetical protein